MAIEEFQNENEETTSDIVESVTKFGKIDNGRFEMSIGDGTYSVQVRDMATNFLVAFSSTQADFEQSLAEFAEDYFS